MSPCIHTVCGYAVVSSKIKARCFGNLQRGVKRTDAVESGEVRQRNKILFPYQTVLPSTRRDSTYNGADFRAYFTSLQYFDLSAVSCIAMPSERRKRKKEDVSKEWQGRGVSLASFFPHNELSIKFRGTSNISRLSHVRWKCCIDLRVRYKATDCTPRLSRESSKTIEKQTREKERPDERCFISLKSDGYQIDSG